MTIEINAVAKDAVPVLDILASAAPFLSGILALTPAAMGAPLLTAFLSAADQGAKSLAAGGSDPVDIVAGLIKQLLPGFENLITGKPAA
jgi:hypothetical protein